MINNEKQAAFDKTVRHLVYDHTMKQGAPTTIVQTVAALTSEEAVVRDSFHRLADAYMLVLQRDNGEILMANPFSAVPTPFLVTAGEQSYYGNCIWDAMGIPAMLKLDGRIETSCGCCRTAMHLEIKQSALLGAEGIVHFAVPAAHWWDDVVFN
jgi:Alkylmercury lyase